MDSDRVADSNVRSAIDIPEDDRMFLEALQDEANDYAEKHQMVTRHLDMFCGLLAKRWKADMSLKWRLSPDNSKLVPVMPPGSLEPAGPVQGPPAPPKD